MTGLGVSAGTSPIKIDTWGTSQQFAMPARSDLVLQIASAGAGSVIMRLNGVQSTLSAYAAGTLTGGRILSRADGYSIGGEAYEFGLLDRTLTVDEIASLEAYAQSHYGRTWPTHGQVIIDGDSLTEGQLAVNYLSWASIMDDSIGGQFIQRSRGLGGTDMNTQKASAAGSATLFDGALAKNVAASFLGTNDLGILARSSAQVLSDMQTWVTAFNGAGFKTVVGTIVARDDTGWSGAKETQRLALNAAIPGLTGLNAVADCAAIPQLANPSDTTYFGTDKIHMKDPAYLLIADCFKTAILSV